MAHPSVSGASALGLGRTAPARLEVFRRPVLTPVEIPRTNCSRSCRRYCNLFLSCGFVSFNRGATRWARQRPDPVQRIAEQSPDQRPAAGNNPRDRACLTNRPRVLITRCGKLVRSRSKSCIAPFRASWNDRRLPTAEAVGCDLSAPPGRNPTSRLLGAGLCALCGMGAARRRPAPRGGLEGEPQEEAERAAVVEGVVDLAEIGRADVGAGLGKLRVIEQVERLGPQQQRTVAAQRPAA